MTRKKPIMQDIINAHEGNEKSIEKLIEHYGYIFERVTEELNVQEQDFEDVNGAMLLGMLKTISQEESKTNFPLYAYRNMRKEAEKCLREIAFLGPKEERKEYQTYDLEDTLDNICASILVDQMMKYLHVSSREVLQLRFGISNEKDNMKSFKELSSLLSDREGSSTVKNLSRIKNEALKELRECFLEKYEE